MIQNNATEIKSFTDRRRNNIAIDKDGQEVFLAESAWTLKTMQENHQDIDFRFTSEKIERS